MRKEDAEWILTPGKGPDPEFYKDNITVMDWIAEAKATIEKESKDES